MRIELRKIKKVYYDDLYKDIYSNMNKYLGNEEMIFNFDGKEMKIVDLSEPIFINGSQGHVNIDISDQIKKLEQGKIAMGTIDFEISKKIFVAFHDTLPRNILYENEFWTYLSHTIFKEYILKRYFEDRDDFDDEEKKDSIANKIRRYYFSSTSKRGLSNQSSRIGIKFLYSLIELTYDKHEQFRLTEIAHRFIDPVKAIYERQIGKNDLIIKAFIKAIEINNYNNKIRSDNYRSLIPKHISNFASVNLLDAYDFYELSRVIAEEQRKILNIKVID